MTISVIFRRATFSVWTLITGSRLRKIAASDKPASARPMAEKTMIFLRFLLLGLGIGCSSKTRAVSDLFQSEACRYASARRDSRFDHVLKTAQECQVAF